MTNEVNAISFKKPIVLNTYPGLPEDEIELEVRYWLSRAAETHPYNMLSYAQQIHAFADHARLELSKMQIAGQPPEAIKRYAQSAVKQLRENCLQIIEAQQTQEQKKVGLARKFREMDVSIQNCGKDINFQGFVPEPKKPHPSVGDPFWAHKQMNVYENIVLARMTGALIEGVGAGIQFACQEPPKVDPIPNIPNPVCMTLEAVGSVMHSVAQLPLIRDVVKEAHAPNPHLELELYAQYGIPKEISQHYSVDAFTKVAPFFLLPPATGAGMKATSVLGRVSKSAENMALRQGVLTAPTTNVPLMEKTFQGIYQVINRNHDSSSVYHLVGNKTEFLDKIVPTLSDLGSKTIDHYCITQLMKSPNELLVTQLVSDQSNLTKFMAQNQTLIARHSYASEVAPKLIGSHFVKSLNLKFFKTTEPLAIGQIPEGGYFLVSPFIQGLEYTRTLNIIGQLSRSPKDQFLLVQDFGRAVVQFGRQHAEIHNVEIPAALLSHSRQLVESEVAEMMHIANHTDSLLAGLGKDVSLKREIESSGVVSEFIENPGRIVYGTGNIECKEVVWTKRDFSTVLIDPKHVANTFNAAKEPLAFSSEEFVSFQRTLAIEGEEAGVQANHIRLIQNSYREGYSSEVNHRSAAGEKFFKLKEHLNELNDEAHAASHGRNPMAVVEKSLETFLKTLNEK